MRRQDGFTLVEVIVYMLISTIVLIMVGQMMGSMNGLFTNTRTRNDTKQLGDTVYNYIAEELRYTTYLSIHDTEVTDPTGDVRLRIDGGRVESNGGEVFSEEFYLGYSIEVETEQLTAYSIDLVVRVLDEQGVAQYETGSTIECINIKITGLGMMYLATNNVNPAITYTRGTKA